MQRLWALKRVIAQGVAVARDKQPSPVATLLKTIHKRCCWQGVGVHSFLWDCFQEPGLDDDIAHWIAMRIMPPFSLNANNANGVEFLELNDLHA